MNVSIIIPHYEKQRALVNSFVRWIPQLERGDEIIIVDDHSPNGVPIEANTSTKIVKPKKITPHIYRLNTLRNLGISKAENDAIILADPDCIPNKNLVKNARTLYDPAILYGGVIHYFNEEGVLRKDRRETYENGFVDYTNIDCAKIYGGLMFFSKKRVSIVGLFDEAYNGSWGCGENDFASACRNSGMRLKIERGLTVLHQYHPKVKYGDYNRNREIFLEKIMLHRTQLDLVTNYTPNIMALMVSLFRPYYINSSVMALFRQPIPVKLRLVNNGDNTQEQRKALDPWRDRWAVELIEYKERQLLSEIRNHAILDAMDMGYKYLLLLDDDMRLSPYALSRLYEAAETHPEYDLIAGTMYAHGVVRMLGGVVINGEHRPFPRRPGVHETDYVSAGIVLVRLEDPIFFTEGWGIGWCDWDWSNKYVEAGRRVACCGDALGYHRMIPSSDKLIKIQDSETYLSYRQNKAEHKEMADWFESKWGYRPKLGKTLKNL